jgi:hypothetical protein
MAKRDHGARVWIEFDPPVIWEKSHPRWPHQYMLQMKITGLKERDGPWYVCEHVLLDHASGDVHALGRSDWADWAHSGDLLYANDGAIYRVRCGSKALAAIGDAACVIDLSDRVFRERKAQAGRLQWPGRSRS